MGIARFFWASWEPAVCAAAVGAFLTDLLCLLFIHQTFIMHGDYRIQAK